MSRKRPKNKAGDKSLRERSEGVRDFPDAGSRRGPSELYKGTYRLISRKVETRTNYHGGIV